MQLTPASLVAVLVLATMASADRLLVFSYCLATKCTRPGTFITDYARHDVNAGDGCRDDSSGVPEMIEFCMDWKNARGHFRFKGQNRRCLKETSSEFQRCNEDFGWATCSNEVYEEVKCTW